MFKAIDYEVITDHDGSVSVRRSDGASIPTDPRNRDYYEFLQVEKTDEKKEIKRTTIPKPEPVKSDMEIILEKFSKIERDISTISSKIVVLEEKVK